MLKNSQQNHQIYFHEYKFFGCEYIPGLDKQKHQLLLDQVLYQVIGQVNYRGDFENEIRIALTLLIEDKIEVSCFILHIKVIKMGVFIT